MSDTDGILVMSSSPLAEALNAAAEQLLLTAQALADTVSPLRGDATERLTDALSTGLQAVIGQARARELPDDMTIQVLGFLVGWWASCQELGPRDEVLRALAIEARKGADRYDRVAAFGFETRGRA